MPGPMLGRPDLGQPSLGRREYAILAAGGCVSLLAWLAMVPWNVHGWMIGAPLGRDFVNFWMAPRLVLAGAGAVLVDLPAYGEAIMAAFGMTRQPLLLFVYPPHALLLFTPFALLPFLPAVLVWTALNLAALAWTTRRIAGTTPGAGLLLAVCLSPPAVAMMMYGHFGGLLALAATLAVTESRRRPVLAGLCLAFLTLKPQLACALGLILLIAGRWRCLLVAGLGTAGLVGLSVAAFGIEVWERFVTVTMPMQSAFVTDFNARMIETSVTAYFAARFSGVPGSLAWAIQGIVAILSLAAGVAALRRGADAPAPLLIVLLAALMIQPYASHYDLAMAAPAMTLVVLARDPAPAPVTVAAWLLTPLARILIVFELPILGVIVPGMLLAQAARLFRPGLYLRHPPRPAVLDAAA